MVRRSSRKESVAFVKCQLRQQVLSGLSLMSVVQMMEDTAQSSDAFERIHTAVSAPLFKRSLVIPLYQKGLGPLDIALRIDFPLEEINKILLGKKRHAAAVSQPVTASAIRTLRWAGGGAMPPDPGGLWDSAEADKTTKSAPHARFGMRADDAMYSEELVDHLVDGDLEGITEAWWQKAQEIVLRLGGAKRAVVARQVVARAHRRFLRDKSGYIVTMENALKRARRGNKR
jgi:hypothetical protein